MSSIEWLGFLEAGLITKKTLHKISCEKNDNLFYMYVICESQSKN